MRIESLTICNFRCFGPTQQRIFLDDLNAFVGANGSGKTAILQALCRMFGTTQGERTLSPDDFHLDGSRNRDDFNPGEELSLSIDVLLRFPDFEDGTDKYAISECFSHMKVENAGESPYCRVRLEGRWIADGTQEGTIEQRMFWVRSLDDIPEDADKHTLAAHERSLIQVHYVPAARDPIKQIRYVTGSMVNRLFKALLWSKETRTAIDTAASDANSAFDKQTGVDTIHAAIEKYWSILRAGSMFEHVRLQPIGSQLDDLLRQLQAVFMPSPTGGEAPTERLSDGLKSIFYMSLLFAVFEIETIIVKQREGAKYFDEELVNAPVLTIFALEELENHVAPHYLGRILAAVRQAIGSGRSQALITSHSPSVLHRVEPEEVRHVRFQTDGAVSIVKPLTMPAGDADAFKYVSEAVRAHPELYFAALVVLGEGQSEEVVIPRLARSMGIELDQSFVSVVPLGGRHVNHFWRLLSDLEIPYVTLLDLDRERSGGAWGRVKYAIEELIKVGASKEALLELEDGSVLPDADFENLPKRNLDADLVTWVESLEDFDVYFSSPLDLDFLLLESYPDVYKQPIDGGTGPRIPATTDDVFAQSQEAAIRAVLKPEGSDGSTYDDDEKLLFFWYRYLFLGRSKPATHLHAMATISDADLSSKAPEVLKRLCRKIEEHLQLATDDQDDA